MIALVRSADVILEEVNGRVQVGNNNDPNNSFVYGDDIHVIGQLSEAQIASLQDPGVTLWAEGPLGTVGSQGPPSSGLVGPITVIKAIPIDPENFGAALNEDKSLPLDQYFRSYHVASKGDFSISVSLFNVAANGHQTRLSRYPAGASITPRRGNG